MDPEARRKTYLKKRPLIVIKRAHQAQTEQRRQRWLGNVVLDRVCPMSDHKTSWFKHRALRLRSASDWLFTRHKWLAASSLLVLIVLVVTGGWAYGHFRLEQRYVLSAATRKLISPASPAFARQLHYDAKSKTYVLNTAAFNASDIKSSNSVQTGSDSKDPLYGIKLPVNLKQGIAVADKTTGLSFSLDPLFGSHAGEQVNNAGQPQTYQKATEHIVYPLNAANATEVYTVENNGVKEDIVLSSSPTGGRQSFSYKLNLPDTLTAKLDADGNLGIYSADPALFGNIAFGDAKSQAEVMKARQDSPKDHLVFVLPAPVIYESGSKATDPAGSGAKFSLKGNVLTVTATGLNKLTYPATIDPSVVVTAATNFQYGGNNEGDISFAGNEISTAGLTGGSMSGAWTTSSHSLSQALAFATSVAYNGYLYELGGQYGGSPESAVYYTAINSDGSINAWSTTTALPQALYSAASVVYNGYIYELGGDNGTAPTNTVYYAAINANGTIGKWNSTTPSSQPLCEASSVAYNGYLYTLGGTIDSGCAYSSGNIESTVYYAPINADGTIGNWASTTSLPQSLYAATSVVYNGYLYELGGKNGGGSLSASVYYAPIAPNGSVGSWVSANALPQALFYATSVAYNGYVYYFGGSNGAPVNTVYYASFNSDGSLSGWMTDVTKLTPSPGLMEASAAAYNGYLYLLAGSEGVSGPQNAVYYDKISPAGITGAYTSTGSALAQGISDAASVAYNGYVYEIGGYGKTSGVPIGTVYSAAIGSNGTLGAWAVNTPLPSSAVRSDEAAAVYNGYLYVLGGYNASYATQTTVYYAAIGSGGTIGTWGTTTILPDASGIASLTSVAYNGYLYALGGWDGTNHLSAVSYAPFCTAASTPAGCPSSGWQGAIGSWGTTTALPESTNGIDFSSTVVAGGYMYEIGGLSNGSPVATVSYAQINTNGTLGSWSSPSAMNLPVALERPTAVVNNGYIYVLGGYNGTADTAAVYYAPLESGGGVGTWVTNTALPAALDTATTVVANGYIYEIGGETGSTGGGGNGTAQSTTYYASINNGGPGGTGSWVTNANSLPGGPYSSISVVAYGGYLYMQNGSNNGIYYASISSNGSISSWTEGSSLSAGIFGAEMTAYNGYIYIAGGQLSGVFQNKVYYASVNGPTIGSWNTSSYTFNNPRTEFGFVAYGGHLYIMGGAISGSVTNEVDYASINADGSINSWVEDTSSPLLYDEYSGAVTGYDGYIYVVGGYGASNLSAVTYAPVNGDGSLGAWQYTTSMPIAISGDNSNVALVAENGYMYVMGGGTNSGYNADVLFVPIGPNGTLGAWQYSLNTYGTPRVPGAAVAYNGRAYMFGGCDGSGCATGLTDVQYAGLDAIPRIGYYSKLVDMTGNPGNGQLSRTSNTGSALPAAVGSAAAVAYDGYLYVLGGWNGSAPIDNTYYAKINTDGSIGSWTPTTALPVNLTGQSAFAYNGYLYVLGGASAGVTSNKDYFIPINTDGSLGSAWTTSVNNLNTPIYNAAYAISNGYVYLLGGDDGGTLTSVVQYALLGAAGDTGVWNTTTPLSGGARDLTGAFAANGYLYTIGGYNGSSVFSIAESIPINGDGTLGSSWNATTSLPQPISDASTVAVDGYVYIIGGQNSTSTLSTVYSARIIPNGTVGPWQSSPSLSSPREDMDVLNAPEYNGYIYLVGGYNSSGTPQSSTLYGTVNSNDPALSSLLMHGTDAGNPGLGGTSGPGGLRVSYKLAEDACPKFGASQTVSFGTSSPFNAPFALPTAITGCSVDSNGRYLWIEYVLDDSQTSTFPDVNGNHTTVSDFTIDYHPGSSDRLRGGATFSNGSLQALDTSP